jgi:hypothetical protein
MAGKMPPRLGFCTWSKRSALPAPCVRPCQTRPNLGWVRSKWEASTAFDPGAAVPSVGLPASQIPFADLRDYDQSIGNGWVPNLRHLTPAAMRSVGRRSKPVKHRRSVQGGQDEWSASVQLDALHAVHLLAG